MNFAVQFWDFTHRDGEECAKGAALPSPQEEIMSGVARSFAEVRRLLRERFLDPLQQRRRCRPGAGVGEDAGDEVSQDFVQSLMIVATAAAAALDLDCTAGINRSIGLRHLSLGSGQ